MLPRFVPALPPGCLPTRFRLPPVAFRKRAMLRTAVICRRALLCSLLLGLTTGSLLLAQSTPASAQTLESVIPDAALRGVIHQSLSQKLPEKKEFEQADLKRLFFLTANGAKIASLQGLEQCTNLAALELNQNQITDLTPLTALVNLQTLSLADNQVVDLAPLGTLVRLQYLDAHGNQVASLAPLQTLTALRTLDVSGNQLASLAGIEPMARLQSLYFDGNQITDLAPLANLKWLASLGARQNRLTSAAGISALTELRFTFLEGNPLTDLQPLVDMAEQDAAGPQRFAPYWKLSVSKAGLTPDALTTQVERLKAAGVRLTLVE